MEITTFSELFQHVEDIFGGEAINPGRRREVTLVIPAEEFDEDSIYEFIPDWNGDWHDEEEEDGDRIGNVVVQTGLAVDSDDESLIPFETDDLDEEDEDEDEDWEDNSNNGWLNDDEFV